MEIKKILALIVQSFFYDFVLIKSDLLNSFDKFYIIIILKIKYVLKSKNNVAVFFGRKWQGDSLYNLLAVEAYVYQIETIRKTIKSDGIKVIFDIGAHIGTYSMLLNKAYSGAKIFCFEPNPITFNILNNNLSGVDGVMLYNIGFSDESGCLQIYYKNKALDSATFEAQRAIEEKNEDLIECKIETLNNFIDISGVKEIDILKIDVEGHEKKVLLSAKNALKITKFLIIEISLNLDFSFSDVIKLFNSDSYNFTLVKIIKVWKNSDGSLAIIELLLKNNNL